MIVVLFKYIYKLLYGVVFWWQIIYMSRLTDLLTTELEKQRVFFFTLIFNSFNRNMNFCSSGLIRYSWWCPICCMYLYWLIWYAVHKDNATALINMVILVSVCYGVLTETLMPEVIEHLNILHMKELLLRSWNRWSFCPSFTEICSMIVTNKKLTGCIIKPFIIFILNKSPIRRCSIHCTLRGMHTNQEIHLIAKYLLVLRVMNIFLSSAWIQTGIPFLFKDYLIP